MQAQRWFNMWRGRASFPQLINLWRSGKKGARKKIRDDANDAKLKGLVDDLKTTDRRLILRAKNTGSWLIVQGNTVTSTVLTAIKSSDYWCTHYYVTPPNLQGKCDSWAMYLSVHHGLSCSNGGLVIIRHNKVCENILYLTRRALTSHCVHDKPFIHQGHSISEEVVDQGRGGLKTIDDILIWGLWWSQADAILNVRFGN